ncbi:hypothetical protein GZ212_15735 [Mangrovimonas sp. CR14]|uniref:hypothetical protein n=1 Tax=Mangrovimonas sp. CR14 TaxID=2706120 RepID=UPI00141DBB4A|nr:hypothetical protein [Mangrovimonas sp. CR14]NIK93612.1 hypothetical protein [Mangrovimonas sp. CR14]
MRRLILIILTLISISCEKAKTPINENLIGFKSEEVGEPGAMYKNGEWIDYEFDTDRIDVKYFEDIIVAKTFTAGNACGKYELNVEFKDDTIELLYYLNNKTEDLCESLKIESLTYIINNPKKIKWEIIK